MTLIPSAITAGDSLSLSIPAPDHLPADGWSVKLLLVPRAETGAALSATSATADPADAGAFLLTVAAATTAAWASKVYTWHLQYLKGAERVTAFTGETTVRPDPASATLADARSTARKALDMIEAYLADANNLQAASYTIAGRSLARYSRAELIAERSKWAAEVQREDNAARAAAGLSSRGRIYVRF